jgi:hypothetical protein
VWGGGGAGLRGRRGSPKKIAFLDAQEAEMPSPGVRLTAGRHEKGGKKRSPQERGDFFSEDPIRAPEVGVVGGGSGPPPPGSGVLQIPRENWTPALIEKVV